MQLVSEYSFAPAPPPSFDWSDAWGSDNAMETLLFHQSSSKDDIMSNAKSSSVMERLFSSAAVDNDDNIGDYHDDNDYGGSFAVLELPDKISAQLKKCWAIVGRQLAEMNQDGGVPDNNNNNNNIIIIPDHADSAHCSGYHPAAPAFSRRYNAHRRGWVLSDGAYSCWKNVQEETENDDKSNQASSQQEEQEFHQALIDLFHILHFLLESLLQATARHLELPSIDWFQREMGPTRQHSQWHVKEFVQPTTTQPPPANQNRDKPPKKQVEWLAAHTDPSLLSIVIHEHTHPEGSRGLEYYHPRQKEWRPISMTTNLEDNNKKARAVVFVGSVLSAMTGGAIPACRHRVVYDENHDESQQRRAVTLFGRPAPTARIVRLPSATLWEHGDEKATATLQHKPIRQEGVLFQDWLSRVARNYQSSSSNNKKKGQERQAAKESS